MYFYFEFLLRNRLISAKSTKTSFHGSTSVWITHTYSISTASRKSFRILCRQWHTFSISLLDYHYRRPDSTSTPVYNIIIYYYTDIILYTCVCNNILWPVVLGKFLYDIRLENYWSETACTYFIYFAVFSKQFMQFMKFSAGRVGGLIPAAAYTGHKTDSCVSIFIAEFHTPIEDIRRRWIWFTRDEMNRLNSKAHDKIIKIAHFFFFFFILHARAQRNNKYTARRLENNAIGDVYLRTRAGGGDPEK